MEKLIKFIAKHDFIIVNYATKLELLKLRNNYPWLQTKIVTDEEVLNEFLGSENDRTLQYIIEQQDIAYEHALLLNNNLRFPHSTTITAKTALLSTLRTNLINEGILPTTQLANLTYGHKNVLVLQQFFHHKLIINLLKGAAANISFLEDFHSFNHKITHYVTGIDEVYGLLNNISHLLATGVSARNIKVLRPNADYVSLIKALSVQFELLFNDSNTSLYEYPEIQSFFKEVGNNEVVIKERLSVHEENDTNVMRALKNLCLSMDKNPVPKGHFVKYLRHKVKAKKYSLYENDGIEFINELPLFSNEKTHYFYINFTEGNAPKSLTNNPFLTNDEKDALGLLNDETSAKCREMALISALSHHQHVHLSYARLFMDIEYKAPMLATKLGYKFTDATLPHTLYSLDYLQYLTSVRRDDLYHYNVLDDDLGKLFQSNPLRDNYRMFNYHFTGINYKHNHVYLSATSIELYNNLPFDYFAKYLLGLKDDTHSNALEYGTFVHNVFEHSTDDESFKFVFAQYLDTGNFNAKDKFFIENTKDIVYLGFKKFNEYQHITKPSNVYKEVSFRVPFGPNFTLSGRIDRLVTFEQNGNTYGLVIDFKTGSIVFEPWRYSSGLNLQLPLYGLLISHDKKLGDIIPVALVISSVKPEKHTLSDSEILRVSSARSLKFKGLLLNNMELLQLLDPTFMQSDFFAGLRVTQQGKVSGTVDQETFDKYLQVTKENVIATFNAIAANEFPVRTFVVNNKRSGEYSEYREISYIPFYEADEESRENDEHEEI